MKEVANHLLSLSAGNDRLGTFLRGYFESNLPRVAMNLVILKQLLKPGDSYLDVGSLGVEPAIVQADFPSCTVKALSYEGNRIGIGPEGFYETSDDQDPHCVNVEQINVERQRFPYENNSFEVVSCFEVLEHLKFSPIPMMKEIKRVLKPQGFVILTTPNINSARSLVRMLCGWSPQQCPRFHNSLEYGVIHPKEYTQEEVRDLLVSLGFELETIRTIDMRQTDLRERAIVAMLSVTIPVLRHLLNQAVFKSGWREKIYVKAKKGGPIISEIPNTLFEPTFVKR